MKLYKTRSKQPQSLAEGLIINQWQVSAGSRMEVWRRKGLLRVSQRMVSYRTVLYLRTSGATIHAKF